MIRVTVDQRAQAPAVGELLGVVLQVQDDGGAALGSSTVSTVN